MARPNSITPGRFYQARATAGVIAADSATLTDANILPTDAFDATGYDSVFVKVEIDNGSSPTVTLEPLFRDPDANDGSRWVRHKMGAPAGVVAPGSAPASQATPAMANGDCVEVVTYGEPLVYMRINAVANSGSTTACRILVKPGMVRGVRTGPG